MRGKDIEGSWKACATVISALLWSCSAPPVRPVEAPGKGKRDRLYFVQFHHPGSEHVPDLPDERSWNTDPHRRKFMKIAARRVTPDGGAIAGDVVAWGEWEPPSKVLSKLAPEQRDEPETLFRPVFRPFFENDPPLMNTDPFVYGGSFLYGNCKQNSRYGPTEMQRLLPGSVILFGSNRGGDHFVLDTVLVVRDFVAYDSDNFREALSDRVPPQYFDVTLFPITYEASVRTPGQKSVYRLYFGATHEKPVSGMFSFFPCKPYEPDDTRGFARPTIRIPGVVDDKLNTWQRMNPQPDAEHVQALWEDVVTQVRDQGLDLCVYADIPEAESTGAGAAATTANGEGR